jgi:hemoglobin
LQYPPATAPVLPDLDSHQAIDQFVELFYRDMLSDPQLAPIFFDVAQINVDDHLPHIKAYWAKLLLGEKGYDRHTMNIHRSVNARQKFNAADFDRWLQLFFQTLDSHFYGSGAERARRVATAIAGNMKSSFA